MNKQLIETYKNQMFSMVNRVLDVVPYCRDEFKSYVEIGNYTTVQVYRVGNFFLYYSMNENGDVRFEFPSYSNCDILYSVCTIGNDLNISEIDGEGTVSQKTLRFATGPEGEEITFTEIEDLFEKFIHEEQVKYSGCDFNTIRV